MLFSHDKILGWHHFLTSMFSEQFEKLLAVCVVSGMKPYYFCYIPFDGTGFTAALDSPNLLISAWQEYGKPVGRNTGYDKDQTGSNPERVLMVFVEVLPDGAGICPRFFVGYTWLHASD